MEGDDYSYQWIVAKLQRNDMRFTDRTLSPCKHWCLLSRGEAAHLSHILT